MTTKSDKFTLILGWVATVASICMYVSHVFQIIDNLNGSKGNPAIPLATAVNCTLWVTYGLRNKDYPLAVANAPGIFFGIISFVTGIMEFTIY